MKSRAEHAPGAVAPVDRIPRSGTKCGRIRMAPMTAALFHRTLFETVGLLDESFESYLEDVDFGLRCAVAGRSGIFVPQAVAYHRGSATGGRVA